MSAIKKIGNDAYGVTIEARCNGRKCSAFILIGKDLWGNNLEATVAHEMFHAFQYAFDASEELWWMESSAEWSVNYYSPYNNSEHQYVHAFLSKPDISIKNESGNHPYGAYLFPLYLQQNYGAGVVAQVEKLTARMTASKAVQTMLHNFRKNWKEFALRNWNRRPVKPRYGNFDTAFPSSPPPKAKHFSFPRAGKSKKVPVDLQRLSSNYYRFKGFPPDRKKIKKIVVNFQKLTSQGQQVGVQAIIKITGRSPRIEDWSHDKTGVFCMGDKRHHLAWFVMIVSNARFDKNLKGSFEVESSESPCGRFKTHYLMGIKKVGVWVEYDEGDIVVDTCGRQGVWSGTETGVHHGDGGVYDIIKYQCDLTFELPKEADEFRIKRHNYRAEIVDLGPNLAPEWRVKPTKFTYAIFPEIYAKYDGRGKLTIYPKAMDGYDIEIQDVSGFTLYGSKREVSGEKTGVDPSSPNGSPVFGHEYQFISKTTNKKTDFSYECQKP